MALTRPGNLPRSSLAGRPTSPDVAQCSAIRLLWRQFWGWGKVGLDGRAARLAVVGQHTLQEASSGWMHTSAAGQELAAGDLLRC
jgi:hypothetical protein